MQRNLHAVICLAHRRLGRLLALGGLLLAGFLFSWGEARAMPAPSAGSELAFFSLQAEDETALALEALSISTGQASCRKPVLPDAAALEIGLYEINDQEALPCQLAWLPPAPALAPRVLLPAVLQIAHSPLLRPPSRQGWFLSLSRPRFLAGMTAHGQAPAGGRVPRFPFVSPVEALRE